MSSELLRDPLRKVPLRTAGVPFLLADIDQVFRLSFNETTNDGKTLCVPMIGVSGPIGTFSRL